MERENMILSTQIKSEV